MKVKKTPRNEVVRQTRDCSVLQHVPSKLTRVRDDCEQKKGRSTRAKKRKVILRERDDNFNGWCEKPMPGIGKVTAKFNDLNQINVENFKDSDFSTSSFCAIPGQSKTKMTKSNEKNLNWKVTKFRVKNNRIKLRRPGIRKKKKKKTIVNNAVAEQKSFDFNDNSGVCVVSVNDCTYLPQYPLLSTSNTSVESFVISKTDENLRPESSRIIHEAQDDETKTSNLPDLTSVENLKIIVERSEYKVYAVGYDKNIILKGTCQVKVLCGILSCFGYDITDDENKKISLYSAKSHTYLTLHSRRSKSLPKYLDLDNLGLYGKDADMINIFGQSAVIFVVWPSFNKICRYLQKFHQNLFCSTDNVSCIPTKGDTYQFKNDDGCNRLRISDDWQKTVERVCRFDSVPTILVCGGKDVGKSTFVKYLMNHYMNSGCDGLFYVEADPGQSEFTPPGCVSLKYVNRPHFGPAYTHLSQTTKCCYVGGISVESNMDLYVSSLEALFIAYVEKCKNLKKIPLVINTMGWGQGLGINLLMDIIRIFHPTNIVQINAGVTRDLEKDITNELVENSPGWRYNPENHVPPFMFSSISSAVGSLKMISNVYSAPVRRSLVVTSYFGQLQKPFEFSPINHFTPYRFSFNDVRIGICHQSVPDEHLFAALNASLVALCHFPSNQNVESRTLRNGLNVLNCLGVNDCLGFGIIRAVDPVSKYFYVISPLSPPQSIRRVNTFLIGNVGIPKELLRDQKAASGDGDEIPYLYSTQMSSKTTNKVVPRRRIVRRRSHGGRNKIKSTTTNKVVPRRRIAQRRSHGRRNKIKST